MPTEEIRTLVCKRDLANAILCYESLYASAGEPFQLAIHEDGSLSDSDAELLQQKFPTAHILRRSEEEPAILECLRNHPKCREYRTRHPISNKLLDIPLSAGSQLRFIDSDILFFRRIKSLFPAGCPATFMFEDDEGHSGPLLNLHLKHRLRIASGFNAGLFSLDLERYYDLDRIEWLLGQSDLMVQIGMADQTCYADLVGIESLRYFSPRQFFCSKFVPIAVTDQTVAVHFVYHLKPKIPTYHRLALEMVERNSPTEVESISPRPLTLWKIVRRRLGRRYRKHST